MTKPSYRLHPVGWVESPLTDRDSAPKQGDEGAPPARVVWRPGVREAAADLRRRGGAGAHLAPPGPSRRGRGPPARRPDRPRQGVFSTRSPDRPNPIGLHPVTIVGIDDDAITVSNLEAIDGTPVLDVKPVLGPAQER